MPTPRRRSISQLPSRRGLCALALAALLAPLSPLTLRAEVNLEALSKKMSQWPREITLIQDVKLNLKQPDGSIKPGKIAKDTKMEVVSVQPAGVEVRLQQTTIILPAAVTDLEERVNKVKATKAAAPAPVPEGTKKAPEANAPVDAEAVRQKFAKAIKDEVLTIEEINTFSEAELKTMPENIQKHVAGIRKQLEGDDATPGKPATKKVERPKPVLQSREMTPFIKELMENLEILEGTNLRPYTNSISFKDKDYYLLIIGAANDEKTKPVIPRIIDFYTRVNRVSKKYEVIYLPLDRTPQGMEAFVKETKMPWPLLRHETVKTSKTFGKYAQWGVPNLVVVDRQGKMVSQGTFSEGENRNYQPQEALFDLASLLQIPGSVFK